MSNSKVKIGNVSGTIENMLREYGEEIRKDLDRVIPDVAKDTAKKVLENARAEGLVRTGAYARGWKTKVGKNLYGDVTATVYNAKAPGLPHLLEFGHAKRGGGRTKPAEHIKPAEEWAATESVKRVKEAIG